MYVTTGLRQCSERVGKCHTVATVCNIVNTDEHRHQLCVAAAYKNNVWPRSQHTNKIPNHFQQHHILTTHFNNFLLSS